MNEENNNNLFGDAAYDVEHTLSMYASSFCSIPASAIYDKEALKSLKEVIELCHIYIIGLIPNVDLVGAKQKKNKLIITLSVLKKDYELEFPLEEGMSLKVINNEYFIETKDGNNIFPSETTLFLWLKMKYQCLNFEVLYIGQAYGKDGSRNAIDRLLKHETLQKIALNKVPEGYKLSLLLLEVEPNTQLLTMFNPFAENKDNDGSRIKAGLDKLFNTTEKEQISLYEASLIRYFSPKYNKEFKNSFPSTNLKILQDCYDKDFSGVSAEICIDEIPFHLYSESVEPINFHIVQHNLHDEPTRKMFFSM